MSWLIDMPSAGRWLVTLGVSAVFLLLASSYRRRTAESVCTSIQYCLNAAGHMLAYLVLALLWMWTLEPVQVELVRVSMSLALALGLGSLTYLQTATSQHRQVTAVNSAGILLGVLTVVVLVSY